MLSRGNKCTEETSAQGGTISQRETIAKQVPGGNKCPGEQAPGEKIPRGNKCLERFQFLQTNQANRHEYCNGRFNEHTHALQNIGP